MSPAAVKLKTLLGTLQIEPILFPYALVTRTVKIAPMVAVTAATKGSMVIQNICNLE